ncbi:hypothetical protein MNBD_GAMMA09-2015 [hydrothermal vent metagenome]|uniref:DinB-like domain-containing protein n=1 Tax=hydrothermal vent metagenome TaxID=652676 RepID=A0A3B0Y3Q2_9ZZZZ
MHKIINGCIEVLEQSESFLLSATPSNYRAITKPYFISSCGEHMRHILDHFTALMNDYDSGLINYDRRERGSQIETDIKLAKQQIDKIKTWIFSLSTENLEQPLFIKTEVSVSEKVTAHAGSCLGRELIFSATHAIHHFSIMSIAMQMQDVETDASFGIAPATQTFIRGTE